MFLQKSILIIPFMLLFFGIINFTSLSAQSSGGQIKGVIVDFTDAPIPIFRSGENVLYETPKGSQLIGIFDTRIGTFSEYFFKTKDGKIFRSREESPAASSNFPISECTGGVKKFCILVGNYPSCWEVCYYRPTNPDTPRPVPVAKKIYVGNLSNH